MPKSRPSTITRLVATIDYINRNPAVSVKELSEHFGRTVRQTRQDIGLLDQAGIDDLMPGSTLEIDWDLYENEDRLQLFSTLDVDAPVALTGEEVTRIILGLQLIATSLSEDERKQLPSTISVLLAAGSQRPTLGQGVQTVVPLVSSEDFQTIRAAIEDEGCVAIEYHDAAGTLSARTVWPTELHLGRDGWLVRAWCSTRRDLRSFRLDRIRNLRSCTEAEETVKPDDSSSLKESSARSAEGTTVEVQLSKESDWMLGESVAKSIRPTKNSLSATFEVWDEAWIRAEIVALAPHVKTTKPKKYLSGAIEHAKEALDLWDSIAPENEERKNDW